MFDCANVEMRELLPELAAGTLDAATSARVEEHVASCAECASELETLRLVRSAFAKSPRVDTSRIVMALPRPVVPARRARAASAPVKRWIDWRIAAALTTITVGGLSLAVTRRFRLPPDMSPRQSTRAIDSAGGSRTSIIARVPDTGRTADTGGGAASAQVARGTERKAQLSFGGGVGDLDAASIEALMGALDELDRAPMAPSAEPDRTPVLPVIGEGSR